MGEQKLKFLKKDGGHGHVNAINLKENGSGIMGNHD